MADDETLSQLYFAQHGFQMALHEAWHSPTIRCHAFYIAACLLYAASFFSCILLDLLWLNQLVNSLLRLFYFSSYSVLWLLKSPWPWFSAAVWCSWLHTALLSVAVWLFGCIPDLSEVFALNGCGSGRALFPECLRFALRGPRMPLWVWTRDGLI
jgi:hypothetical protein